jgi:hypothetical protein
MTTYTWNGVYRDWSDATDWTPSGPSNSLAATRQIGL